MTTGQTLSDWTQGPYLNSCASLLPLVPRVGRTPLAARPPCLLKGGSTPPLTKSAATMITPMRRSHCGYHPCLLEGGSSRESRPRDRDRHDCRGRRRSLLTVMRSPPLPARGRVDPDSDEVGHKDDYPKESQVRQSSPQCESPMRVNYDSDHRRRLPPLSAAPPPHSLSPLALSAAPASPAYPSPGRLLPRLSSPAGCSPCSPPPAGCYSGVPLPAGPPAG